MMVLKKLDKITFVPVLNGSILNCALRDDLFIDGKRSTFYTNDGIFDYPTYLINPFHHADIFKRIKEKKLLIDNSVIFADSVTKNETIIVRDSENNISNVFIGDFVDKFVNKRKRTLKSGHEVSHIKNYEILTIDNNFKQCFMPIKKVIRHKTNKQMYRVLTTSGLMIEVTEDHSLINLDKNMNFIEVSVKDLAVREDRLLGIKKYDIFDNKFLKEKNGVLLDKIMLEFFGLWIGDGCYCKNSNDIGLSGVHIPEVMNIFRKIANYFGLKVYYRKKYKYDATIHNKKLLCLLVKMGFDGRSNTKRVPSWVFNLSKEQIGSFLRGYFEADGSVKVIGKSVGACTVSKGLFNDVIILLKVLGISCCVRYEKEGVYNIRGKTGIKKPSYIIQMYGKDNLVKFNKYIGFISSIKKDKLNEIITSLKNVNPKNYFDNVPLDLLSKDENKCVTSNENAISISRLSKNGFTRFNDMDIGFYLIKTIEKINYNDYVYDISVDKLERFLCSGVLVHNSGGLQEITLNQVKHEPDEVFRWQQEHTNIGFSVDSLPFITPKDGTNKPGSFGGWKFDKAGFIGHAEKSKNNIEVTKKYRDRTKYPDFYFYGIIQGRGYDEYKRWYNVIRDEYLDGYCCKAPNINPITLAETAIFALNNIVKPVHFLGIGNMSRSIVLYYASKYFKQPITFDSSSYDIGTQYRSYLLPFMMNKKVRFVSEHNLGEDSEVCNKNDVVNFEDATELCDCVVCRAIGNKLGEMIRTNDPILGGLISVHNLILNLKYINYIKGIINNACKLEEFVKSNFEVNLANKILTAFKMLDMNDAKGPEYTFHYFRDKVQDKNKEEKVQSTIFGF